MIKKPKLSIVTITYNQEKFIAEALDSFIMQETNFDVEIIVADDASSDRTPEIIKNYAEKHGNIKPVLRKKNIGAIENSIATLKAAKGQYIALCEGDDYWTDPNKLQKQVDFLDANPDYAICFHPVRVIFDAEPHKNFIWPGNIDKKKLNVASELKENFIPTNSVVFRRQKYDDLPRNIMPLDWYLHLYNAQFGRIGFIDEVMSVYRRHDKGLWWDNDIDKSLLWKKYGLAMLGLHNELDKLYGHDTKYKAIIKTSIEKTLNELINIDQNAWVDKATNMFPEVASQVLMKQHYEIQNQKEDIEKKAAQIEELNREIIVLRAKVYEVQTELHNMMHSRVLGKIIKLRNFVGNVRKALSPGRIVHGIRVVVAPFIPRPIRKLLKWLYRSLKHILLSRPESERQIKIVENELWPKGKPLVSVVIPYYNRADTIDETLYSLENQTFKNFETIIVDDGSTDPASIEKLKNLKADGFPAQFINQSNQGVAAARNNGIKQAEGKYIICLDSDDILDSTYIEKCTVLLESNPDIALATTYTESFGVVPEIHRPPEYNPVDIIRSNTVITAAEYQKVAWEKAGGYKSGIGYEDWEFWVSLSERGFWGKQIPEPLFRYRTDIKSRYVEDRALHWKNLDVIRQLHPEFQKKVKRLLASRRALRLQAGVDSALINLNTAKDYRQSNSKRNILIALPWMTFGGAETLIVNFCNEIKPYYNLAFITGLESENEWEYKFKEISSNVYHLASLFDSRLYVEFFSNYINTRKIDVLHIIHTSYVFDFLPELKKRHPQLKVVVTLFNDRAEHFENSINVKSAVDAFTTDNKAVQRHLTKKLADDRNIVVIPNGINSMGIYNPMLYDRPKEREELGIKDSELAVFFIGRLSEEKNPDVFLNAADQIINKDDNKAIKFFIIGDGNMRAEVEKRIKDIGSDNLQYLGYQPDIARYLSTADIFVLPSSIEGFPLSILEAMAMGVAVISSKVGAVPDIIIPGEDGFLVTPGAKDEIAAKIIELQKNPKLLTSIKRRAREKVDNQYSNKLLGQNYRRLYETLQ